MIRYRRVLAALLASSLLVTITPPVIASANESTEMTQKELRAERQADARQIASIEARMDDLLRVGKQLEESERGAMPQPAASKCRAGSTGEFWVSTMMNSGSVAFTGHAAIVSSRCQTTIESYAKRYSPIKKDGVQRYGNSWRTRPKAFLLRPKRQSAAKYRAAAKYAEGKVGRPYNWSFINKKTEKKFYCSQLVWRAWLKQGIDIEKGSIPNKAVTPADLVNSSNTYIVRRNK